MDEQDKELPAEMPEQIELNGVLAEPGSPPSTGEAYTEVDRPHEQPEQDESGEPLTETLTAEQI